MEPEGEQSKLTALRDIVGADVPRETLRQIDGFADLLRAESAHQNLIAASTLDMLWSRHILDSAQLVRFEPDAGASWVDIGSGAGLPGIVIAILVNGPVLLVEPRRLRAQFLERAINALGLRDRASVCAAKAQKATGKFDVITARAVASVDSLLAATRHLSTRKSLWVLPKGRSAQSELAEAKRNWQCESEVVPSRTDPDSAILLLRKVRARGRA